MYRKILVTGGAGFIGSKLSLKLLSKGFEVTVLDNLNPQIHGENPERSSPLYMEIADKVRFIMGSVNDRKSLENALENQDVIVHLAAETGTGQSMYEIERYNQVNVAGTALMLDIIANQKTSVKKILVASSRAVYGEGRYYCEKLGYVYPEHRRDSDLKSGIFEVSFPGCKELLLVATDEQSKLHPSSIYGITKQIQEQLVMTVTKSLGIAGVTLRYQNVYGPGQSLSNPYTGILSIFSTRIKNGNPINIFEDGKESRDFVYIDDVINATVLAIEDNRANDNIFNVGSGVPTDVNTVVAQLLKNYKKKVPVKVSGNYRLGDIRHNYADLTKIQKLLGFQPKISFEDGVSRFCSWVSQQNVCKDSYEVSLAEMKNKGLLK